MRMRKQLERIGNAVAKGVAYQPPASLLRLAVLLLFLAIPAMSYALDFTYTTQNNQVTITGYTGSSGNVVIPNTINGLPVTSIGYGAFYNCSSLNTVWIGCNVTVIYAFVNCPNLVGVYFQGNAPTLYDPFSSFMYVDIYGWHPINAIVYNLPNTAGWGSSLGFLPVRPFPFTYTVTNGVVTITGYIGPNANGVAAIPSTIFGQPVTQITESAFSSSTAATARRSLVGQVRCVGLFEGAPASATASV